MKTAFYTILTLVASFASWAMLTTPARASQPGAPSAAGAQNLAQPAAVTAAPAHPEPWVPPIMRRPPRDAAASGPALQYQAMQKLKKRFDEADLDGNGSLSREEAHKAGLGFVDKNFEHIDSAQRGAVTFEDLKTYLIQRREEARSR